VCYCVRCCEILTNSKLFVRCKIWGSEDVKIKLFCNVTSCGFVDRSQLFGGNFYCIYCLQDGGTAYLRPVSQNFRRHALKLLPEDGGNTILLNFAVSLSKSTTTDPLSALRKRRQLSLLKRRHMYVALHSALSLKKLLLVWWNLFWSVRLS
jgi:hypothetical protein